MKTKPLDILLVTAPVGLNGVKKNPWRYVLSSNIAYGAVSLASYLARHEINAEVLDAAALFLTNDETVKLIKRINPSSVGFSATTSSISNAGYIGLKIKEFNPDIVTIVGGPHVSSIGHKTMEIFESFDMAILREGEITLLEVIQQIRNRRFSPASIPGIMYREGKKILRTQDRPFIENLSDVIPFPRWDLVREPPAFPNAYKAPIFFTPSPHVATMTTSRGCPFKCNFCDKSVSGDRFRSFTAEYIIECVKKLVKDYGIRHVIFYDDNFTVDKDRLIKICELMRKNCPPIAWSCDAHTLTLDGESIKCMAKARCWSISFGLESGSPKVLESLGKTGSADRSRDIVNRTYDSGIKTKGLFMLGSPRETLDTINETIQFIKSLRLSTLNLSMFTPYPGTQYYAGLDLSDEKSLWPNLDGTTFTNINEHLSIPVLTREYRRVLKSFYHHKKILLQHLGRIFGSRDHVTRLSKSAFSVLLTGWQSGTGPLRRVFRI